MDPASAALPVSCYIRTLDEERIIARCILAAQAVASDVVVVDSGSGDRTVEIAQSMGARVFRQPWLGNGFQKRFAEEHCRHDWLLDLDADEIITPELATEMRALFAGDGPTGPVYEFTSVTVPPIGKPWHDFFLVYRRKLYDRRAIRMPEHKAWDQLDIPPGMIVQRLGGAMLHYSFRDLGHLVEKLNRVSAARARHGQAMSRPHLAMRVLFALPFYFFKPFFMRGLWRGGIYGVALAGVLAYGRWLRDVKAYEALLFEQGRGDIEAR